VHRMPGDALTASERVHSCMRAMIDRDIPLNAGCLVPLESKLARRACVPTKLSRRAQSSSRRARSSRPRRRPPSAAATSSPASGSPTSSSAPSKPAPPLRAARTTSASASTARPTGPPDGDATRPWAAVRARARRGMGRRARCVLPSVDAPGSASTELRPGAHDEYALDGPGDH
jgi:hypothetical protein